LQANKSVINPGYIILECGVVGDIGAALEGIAAEARPQTGSKAQTLRETIVEELSMHESNTSFPMVPQRIILDLRKALQPDDIVVLIDCPVDYSENMKLTEKLGNLVCPI